MRYYLKKNFSVLFPICLGTGILIPLLVLLFSDKAISILAIGTGFGIIGASGCWILKDSFKSEKEVGSVMRERAIDEINDISKLLNGLVIHDSCESDFKQLKNKLRFVNHTIQKL